MGLAASEGIDKDLTKGFLIALDVDAEDVHKAKSVDVCCVDADTDAAAIAAAQWPGCRAVKGIHGGALQRFHSGKIPRERPCTRGPTARGAAQQHTEVRIGPRPSGRGCVEDALAGPSRSFGRSTQG